MDTPDKLKLCLQNSENYLKSSKIKKSFDEMKISLIDLSEISVDFFCAGQLVHFINVTRSVEEVKLSIQDNFILIHFLCFDQERNKSVFLRNKEKNKTEIPNSVIQFVNTIQQFKIYSEDKNNLKLQDVPKNYRRRLSFTPVNKLKSVGRVKDSLDRNLEIEEKLRYISPIINKKTDFEFKTPDKGENRSQKDILSTKNDFFKSITKRLPFDDFESQRLLTPKKAKNSCDGGSQKVSKNSFESDNYSNSGGFINLGNSCYINAVVQAVLNLKPFVSTLKAKQLNFSNNNLYNELLRLHSKRKITERAIKLTNLKRLIDEKNNVFLGNKQQDAHEFLMNLLDAISSAPSRSKKMSSPTEDTFRSAVFPLLNDSDSNEHCMHKLQFFAPID